ncbi:acyltransferase family protein [Sphingomonas bacterium]|uniref:acyltransferase family protein n=1 Tax=Sphingomonas bacterium TaxID=1895847 RepID=UPI0015760340|nr:acyltransferase [Sphingomonas bacterium]
MLTNLQGLRALAAIGVVVFHVGLLPGTALPCRVGAAGVDLFFVLSGFIIAHSASRSAHDFLKHRLIRVLPAYWIATLIAGLFTLRAMDVPGATAWIGQSLLYLPGPGGRPVLIFVAWTLVYELAFYLLFWLALRFGAGRACWLALGALVALAFLHLPGTSGPWPLLLEFAMGLIVFLLVGRTAATGRVSGAVGLAAAGLGLVLLVVLPRLTGYDPDDYQGIGRVFTWGVPAAIVLAGLVIAEHAGWALRSRPVLLLGAASYSLYLLHPIALGQLLQLPARPAPVSWALCAAAVVAIAMLAVAFHLLVEAPIVRGLRALLRDRLPAGPEAQASGHVPRSATGAGRS